MQNLVLSWSLLSVLAGCTAVTSFGDYEVVDDGGTADGTMMDGTTEDADPPPDDAGPPPEDGGTDAPVEDTGPPPMDGGMDAGDDAGTSLCGTPMAECVAGTVNVECTTSCGTMGMGTCTAECRQASGDACVPPAEICDGLDNNCDGMVDEEGDGVTWRSTSRLMTEVSSADNPTNSRVVGTPRGPVVVWAGLPTPRGGGNDARIEYKIARLGDTGRPVGSPLSVGSFEGDTDDGDTVQVKGFAAIALGTDVLVAYRQTVIGNGIQVARYSVPIAPSSPVLRAEARPLYLPEPARPVDDAWMVATDAYAVLVTGTNSFGSDHVHVIAVRGGVLSSVDEPIEVPRGSRPFLQGGRVYVATDEGTTFQVNGLDVDVGTNSTRLTPVAASSIDLLSIYAVVGGDDSSLVVNAASRSTSVIEVGPPDFDCTDCTTTELAARRYSWGLHSGGRWVFSSYDGTGDMHSFSAFSGDFGSLAFDFSRSLPSVWGPPTFAEDDGDFVLIHASNVSGPRRLYHTRYTCFP